MEKQRPGARLRRWTLDMKHPAIIPLCFRLIFGNQSVKGFIGRDILPLRLL